MKKTLWVALIILGLFAIIILLRRIIPLCLLERPLREEKPPVKVAIVIDDWGYNMKNIELLDSIEIPLTISILPALACSADIANRLRTHRDREIILHMPMEPEDETIRLEENTLLTSMDKRECLFRLKASLKTVPHALGLSNHMGSKAAQDHELIGTVMKELKRRDLYFLDSLATPKSICQEEADRRGLRFTKRDIFLDNIADRGYISSQVERLIRLARRRGAALGIGHDRTLTLEVIKEKAEELKETDIRFVFASELAKKGRKKGDRLLFSEKRNKRKK